MGTFITIIFLIAFIIAIAVAWTVNEDKRRRAAEQKYATASPQLRSDIVSKIIRVGMSEEQVIDSWGQPSRRTFSQLKTKQKIILYFGTGNRVYLDNGYVTGWHTPTSPRR